MFSVLCANSRPTPLILVAHSCSGKLTKQRLLYDVQKGSVSTKIEMERYGRTSSDSTSTEHKTCLSRGIQIDMRYLLKTHDLSTNQEVISV